MSKPSSDVNSNAFELDDETSSHDDDQAADPPLSLAHYTPQRVKLSTFLYCSADCIQLNTILKQGGLTPIQHVHAITANETRWLWQCTAPNHPLRDTFLGPLHAQTTQLGSAFVYGSIRPHQPAPMSSSAAAATNGTRCCEDEQQQQDPPVRLLRWLVHFWDVYYRDLTRSHVFITQSCIPLARLQMATHTRGKNTEEWGPVHIV